MSQGDLYFSIDDELLDEKLGLDNVSLPILKEFIDQVSSFIKGGESIDLNSVKIQVKPGSFAIVAPASPLIQTAVSEYRMVQQGGSLDNISPVRAKVIADLQEKARKNPNRLYVISDDSNKKTMGNDYIRISADTDYTFTIDDQWIDTEAYVYGKVYDMGGKSKSNVHLTLSNGNSIKLGADESVLAEDSENRLYKDQLVHIKAQRNMRTKQLRNEQLVSFEHYEPHFNEDDFSRLVAKTKKAWSDVPDIVRWVEEIRGNNV